MKENLKALIGLLYDISAEPGARDDAPFYLSEHDAPEALEALLLYANKNFNIPGDDLKDVSMLKGSCGEAIAVIWLKKGIFDFLIYKDLSKEAQQEIKGLFKAKRPDLVRELSL